MMKRRDFLELASAAAAFPSIALAQQTKTKRLGFTFTLPETDPQTPNYVTALKAGLGGQGWEEGRNLVVDSRWNLNTPDPGRTAVADLLGLKPDVLLITGSTVPVEAAKLTSIVPIVFALAVDPIGLGLVNNFAHPSANVTGSRMSPRASRASGWSSSRNSHQTSPAPVSHTILTPKPDA